MGFFRHSDGGALRPTWLVATLLLCTIFLGVVLATRRSSQSSTEDRHPVLFVSSTDLDLGSGKPSELLTGHVTVQNLGDSDLTFTAQRTCSCTLLEPSSGTIPPNGSIEIEVGLQLTGAADCSKNARVDFLSNDPLNPNLSVAIRGVCDTPFLVSPRTLGFGRFPISDFSYVRPLILQVRPASGKPPFAPDAITLEYDDAFFEVTKLSGTHEPRRSDEVSFEIQLREMPPLGVHSKTLRLSLTNSEDVVTVPITLDVVPNVSLIPSSIRIDRDSLSQEHRILMLSNARTPTDLNTVELIDPPDGVSILDVSTIRPGLLSFVLSIENNPLSTEPRIVTFACGDTADHIAELLLEPPETTVK